MRLLEFFQEGSGNLSSTRLVMIAWALTILTVWAIASCKAYTLAPIPESVITMFGISILGKVSQRFSEGKTEPENPPK
jgi:hypothetical protein